MSTCRRFLVVPDPAFDGATVVSATAFSADYNQAGRQVSQPTKTSDATPIGDIAVTLAGEPETHVEGIVRLTRGGVVEDARYGWIRAEDDPDTDLQFRQSPHVVGRHQDNIYYSEHATPLKDGYRSVRPRLLALKSGDAMLVWTERQWSPIWARQTTVLGTAAEQIYISVLDHETDLWSTPDNTLVIPAATSGIDIGVNRISAVDITQFPDTGEIIMCVATCNDMDPVDTSARLLFVYQSVDDGASWVQKHRLHFDGLIPDIILDADGDGTVDDETPVQDWALELLDSGRLCLLMATEDYTWSLTSDDRGASWSPTFIDQHGVKFMYAGHGCGASKARNGMACYMQALRRTDSDFSLTDITLRFTRDGVTWSEPIEVAVPGTGPLPIFQSVDVTVCISPDGWPHVYGTEHASRASDGTESDPVIPQDWLWGRRLKTRDPSIADTAETVLPSTSTMRGQCTAFHLSCGTPLGSYRTDPETDADYPVYQGFVGIDAIEYRGQVLMATTAVLETGPPVTWIQANLTSSAMMVYRLNHWQPAQEQLGNVMQPGLSNIAPAFPAVGRVYNMTWDCYGAPDNWGFAKTGAATVTTVPLAEGGYLKIAGGQNFYTRALPTSGAPPTLDGAMRFVVHVEEGGAINTDDIAGRIRIQNAVPNHTDISVWLWRHGAGPAEVVTVGLFDHVAGVGFGTNVDFPPDGWIEVIYAQNQLGPTSASVYCKARHYDRDTDPDWDAPYQTLADSSTRATVGGAGLSGAFGHFTSATSESWWKTFQCHRPLSLRECALASAGDDYNDSDGVVSGCLGNDRTLTGTGEAPLDNGIDNWMRTCRTLAVPRAWLDRGVRTAFRGEAITEGNWDYTTGYAFAAANVQIQPVLREWRGVGNATASFLVFQAPTGCGMRPDALAIFGHNLPGFIIQFNATNSWSSPAVQMVFGIPGIPGSPSPPPDRYIHMWALDGTDPNWLIAIVACRLQIKKVGGTPSAWRPHQFKSDAGGQRYYCGITETGTGDCFVFRIVDNTATVLELDTDPSTVGIVTGEIAYDIAIYSDRFAVQIGHHFDAAAKNVGYEFCRFIVGGCLFASADYAFPRIGRIIMGTAVEISAPDFERGWTVGTESGSIVVDQPTGATYTHRLRPTLRTWTADRPFLMAPEEADAVYQSPIEGNTRASTAQWYDTVRRIEGDGVACALVWDGERFVGMDGEERVQVCADPLGLAMCHVRGLGDLENLVYDGQVENLPGGAACVPRPVSHIRGLTFRETL